MRVVLDTNVLVSGIFFKGPPFEILNAWRDGHVQLAVTPEIVREYEAVLARLQAQYPTVVATDVLVLVLAHADFVTAPPLPEPVCADPDDDKFIACAVAADARFIISGDQHLLSIAEYEGVLIVRPRAFLDAAING